MVRAHLLLFVLLLTATGCAGGRWPFSSKWAMADADYAARYARPYPEGERYRRMAKQMVDARHVAGKGGAYVAGSASHRDGPATIGGEIGAFTYPTPWLEARAALAGVVGADADERFPGQDAFLGLNTGLRVQSPSRFAPFIGAGTFAGVSSFDVPAEDDGLDNDDDFFVDEHGEVEDESALFAAVYPEVGAHFWLKPRLRLTGSASYYVTTEGRDHDFWYFGISLSWLDLKEPDDSVKSLDLAADDRPDGDLAMPQPALQRLPPP